MSNWSKSEVVERFGKTFDVFARTDESGYFSYSATVRQGQVLVSYPSKTAIGHRNPTVAVREAN